MFFQGVGNCLKCSFLPNFFSPFKKDNCPHKHFTFKYKYIELKFCVFSYQSLPKLKFAEGTQVNPAVVLHLSNVL
jgi:hypothetical protein